MDSAYDNDPRVIYEARVFTMTVGGEQFFVCPWTLGGWGVSRGDTMEHVGSSFETPDEAIASLIGPPQVAS